MADRNCIPATLAWDAPVGWRRKVLLDDTGRAFRLSLDIEGRKALSLGDMHLVRVVRADPSGGGVFAVSGGGDDVYLKARSLPLEGALVAVTITAERRTGKCATASLASPSLSLVKGRDRPGLLSATEDPGFLSGIEITDEISGIEAEQILDAAIDEALAGAALLSGGGVVSVEPTRALVAVDVDTQGRIMRGDRRALNMAVNMEAADAAARLLGLGGHGGLIVADFLRMSAESDRQKLSVAWSDALRLRYGRRCDVGRFTGFGLLEATVSHGCTPIRDLLDGLGKLHRTALDLFAAIEREGRANRASRLECRVSQPLFQWLERTDIGWKAGLTDRLGPRFTIVADPLLAVDSFDVRSK